MLRHGYEHTGRKLTMLLQFHGQFDHVLIGYNYNLYLTLDPPI